MPSHKEPTPNSIVPIHGPQVGYEPTDNNVPVLPGITVETLVPPEASTFKPGESISVLQVNAKDNRDATKGEVGALYPEAAEKQEALTEEFLGELLDSLPEDDKQKVDIMVIASSAKLKTLVGVNSEHKRAVDTGEHAIVGFTRALEARGLDSKAVVNNRGLHAGEVFETESLVDVPFLHDTSEKAEAYRQEMIEKYGASGFGIWAAYEGDSGKDRELREDHGISGPVESADTVKEFMDITQGFTQAYQEANPDRRLIIWAVGHYDSLTHYIKRDVLGEDIRDTILPMDKMSGIVIHTSQSGVPAIET